MLSLNNFILVAVFITRLLGMSIVTPINRLKLGVEIHPSIEVFNTQSCSGGEPYYRGLRTKGQSSGKIDKDEVFLRIPLENTFYIEEEEEEDERDPSWPIVLAYKLVRELEQGEESKWWTYFESLPSKGQFEADMVHHWEETSTAAFYEDDDEVLYDSSLVCESICNAKSFREEAVRGACSADAAELVSYALDLVQTRCCGFADEEKGIKYHVVAPGFDMMNHSPHIHSAFFQEVDDEGTRFLSCCHRGQAIEGDTEVFLNYAGKGELSQEACFALYGFVVDRVGYYQYYLPKKEVSKYLFESLLDKDAEVVCVMDVFTKKQLSLSEALVVSEDQMTRITSPLRVAARILASSDSKDELKRLMEEDSLGPEHEVRSVLKLRSMLEDKMEHMKRACQERTRSKSEDVRRAFLRNNIAFLEDMLRIESSS